MSSPAMTYEYSSHRAPEYQVPNGRAAMNFASRTDAVVDRWRRDPTLTFRFLSIPCPFESHRVGAVDQKHLMAALKLSLPCSTILLSKEKTAVYPVLQFSHGHNDLDTRSDGYTIQGYATKSCLYSELRTFEPDVQNGHNDPQSHPHFIILGFKTSDTQALLDSWKDWTGARYIYINFPDQLSLRKITLFHKQTADEVNLFNYIVQVECDGVNDKEKQILLLDFVQRLRAERNSNFCSLYEEVIT